MSGQVDFEVVDLSKDFSTAREYGIQVTPTFVVLGKDGAVMETHAGGLEREDLERLLEEALSQ